jgi:hypothetical protein
LIFWSSFTSLKTQMSTDSDSTRSNLDEITQLPKTKDADINKLSNSNRPKSRFSYFF